MIDEKPIDNPFPGLRPFEEDEECLFFGREKEVTDLTTQLRDSRFLAVIGSSGSGKSSLIKAGLLPTLHRGGMAEAGSHWRVALFRPGDNPIGNLAHILEQTGVCDKNAGVTGDEPGDEAVIDRFIEVTLRRSDRGLIEVVRQAHLPENENLLIVVDQFEELFRFRRLEQDRGDGKRDSAVFIKLLLETRRQTELPIYIILTMRSDFLGDCTAFNGLPEAINNGQYLIPRMNREEKRAAITGPIAVGGGEISPPLLSRLLNDVGDNPDQLPILQHALMRTWDFWDRNRGEGEAITPIDIYHYEFIGTMEQALSRHAEEAFAQLKNEKSRVICETLFKLITDTGETGRGVRRPARLSEICRAADAKKNDVIEVIEVFRKPGRTFLMPPHGTALDEDSVIDISHESFMRIWTRLTDWVKEEAQSAELYTRLAKSAALYESGKVGLWRDPELMLALRWREEERPNAVWSQRYDSSFDRAIDFLEKSKKQQDLEIAEKEREQRAKIKRTRIFAAIISVAAVISIILALLAVKEKNAADSAREYAEKQKEIAQQNAREAEKQKEIARENEQKAEQQKEIAQENEQEANRQRQEAERQKEIAEKNEKTAELAKLQAQENEKQAIKSQINEQIHGLAVQLNTEKTIFRQYLAQAKKLAVMSIAQAVEKELKARMALTAYIINREAFDKLKRESEKILNGYTRDDLDSDQKERLKNLRETESKNLKNLLAKKSVQPVVFRALREAFNANEQSRDILYRNVESWALAVPGPNTIVFNTRDGELLTGSLFTPGFVLPVIREKDTVMLPGEPLEATSLLETDNRLFCGTGAGSIIYWEKNNWKDRKTLARHQGKILSLAFSADKNSLFYSIKNVVYRITPADSAAAKAVIRLDQGTLIRTLAVIDSPGHPVLITADSKGNIFLSAVKDGGRGIMDKKQLYANPDSGGFYAIAWSPAGKLLALGNSRGEIFLFPVTDPGTLSAGAEKIKPVTAARVHRGIVRALAFSPDGRYLVSGSYDGFIMLWDLKKDISTEIVMEEPVLTIPGNLRILSLAFDKSGRNLIFSDSIYLRICPINPEAFYEMLEKKGITLLYEEEWKRYIGEGIKKGDLIGPDSR